MVEAGLILGDWTHRRADAMGTRSVSADIGGAKPSIAWTFRPPHGEVVQQIRTWMGHVVVVTAPPEDPLAPNWWSSIVYVLDITSGEQMARRALPDPVPATAVAVDAGMVHVLATREGEPIFWYGLMLPNLAAAHRRVVLPASGMLHAEVLDVWVKGEGSLWLEVDDAKGGRCFVWASAEQSVRLHLADADDKGALSGVDPSDACVADGAVFAPSALCDGVGQTPSLWRIALASDDRSAGDQSEWALADVSGPRAGLSSVMGDGIVHAVAYVAEDTKADRLLVQGLSVGRTLDVVRMRSEEVKLHVRPGWAGRQRVALRPSGELLFQPLLEDGTPAGDVVAVSAEGEAASFLLGSGKFSLDVVVGDRVLAHHERALGKITLAAFDIDKHGRFLGRRSHTDWAIDLEPLGGSTAVYAGSNHILVRGHDALVALAL